MNIIKDTTKTRYHIIGTVAVAGLVLGLTGCIVTSVSPFYFEKDVAFEPALLGDWSKGQGASEHWKFEREGETAYRLTWTEDEKSSVMQAHLFQLGGQRFLDLVGAESGEHNLVPPIPAHLLVRIVKTGPTLQVVPLDYDWLGSLLEKDPKAIRHHIVRGSGDKRLVLTADTSELQRFVLKHLQTEAAWKEQLELHRDPAMPKAASMTRSANEQARASWARPTMR